MGIFCKISGHDWEDIGGLEKVGEHRSEVKEDGEVVGVNTWDKMHYEKRCQSCGKEIDGTVARNNEFIPIEEVYSQEQKESVQAHEEAVNRDKPVEIGQQVKAGVEEIKSHYSDRQDAVIRIEGFVIFVKDVSQETKVGDVLEATVTSFNKDGNSANAVLKDR